MFRYFALRHFSVKIDYFMNAKKTIKENEKH